MSRFLIASVILVWMGCLLSCKSDKSSNALDQLNLTVEYPDSNVPHLIVLGIAQDAGYPQADCKKSCCKELWNDKSKRKMVSCLGLRDPSSKKAWLFDATPDFKDQLKILEADKYELAGIFLTHAHMGHYTGLMHLGREAMGAKKIPVYVMPRMKEYLETNGPWSQLVSLENIEIRQLQSKIEVPLTESLNIKPFLVPHRDEFSETVGFEINSKKTEALFIPDIDKWEKWDEDINLIVKQCDYAFLDGSFYRNGEIWGRDMSQIPHPFIEESLNRFSGLEDADKKKIHFIHFNHTNPVLDQRSMEYIDFEKTGFRLAEELQIVDL